MSEILERCTSAEAALVDIAEDFSEDEVERETMCIKMAWLAGTQILEESKEMIEATGKDSVGR